MVCIFADCIWDIPECYTGIIYAMEKTGAKCVSCQVPVDFAEIAKRMGNMSHQHLWCRMHGKFLAIEHAQKHIGVKNAIAFEGARRAETRPRVYWHWFSLKAKDKSRDTFRLVVDMTDDQICDHCVKNGYPLIGAYEYFDRTGCTCCPEKTPYVWAGYRLFYPNIFKACLQFMEAYSCDPHWVRYYAKTELEKLFRVKLTKENFDRPHS